MTRYIAFLRAVNVGGHVVKMDQLRTLLGELSGVSKIETHIASGNVIFESSTRNPGSLEKRMSAHLQKSLGYEVATFIRTAAQVTAIAEHRAFPESELKDAHLYVGFLASALSPAAKRTVMSFKTEVDDFHVHEREIYWLCRIRSHESEFSLARLEKALGIQATFRNSTTVRKLAALYGTPISA